VRLPRSGPTFAITGGRGSHSCTRSRATRHSSPPAWRSPVCRGETRQVALAQTSLLTRCDRCLHEHLLPDVPVVLSSCALWGYRREIAKRLRSWWPWLSLAVLFPLFWLGFVNDHPHTPSTRIPSCGRESGLFLVHRAPQVLFFLAVALACLCVASVPMKAVALCVSSVYELFRTEWLVTAVLPRPAVLFLLAREQSSPWSERLSDSSLLHCQRGIFVMSSGSGAGCSRSNPGRR